MNPVDYSVIKDIPGLSGMEFLKNKNGSFFKLTKDEYNILMKLIRGGNPMHNPQYSETIFLDNVFIKSDEYNKLRNLLLARKMSYYKALRVLVKRIRLGVWLILL